MSDGRIPRFEIHIRPMFRLLDRDHMLAIDANRAFDLHDYNAVVNHAKSILDHLKSNMPTIPTGGPWPEEWIALFDRWIAAGYPRLEPITAGNPRAQTNGKIVILRADVQKTRPDDRIWFERFSSQDSPREYWLYREPGTRDPAPSPALAEEKFAYKPGVDTVTLVDAGGPQQIRITRV